MAITSKRIREAISYINNPRHEGGGFWLPNIQRPFVWSEEQICQLFDSILREYPISTMLIWKTTSDIRCRQFIENWTTRTRLTDFYTPQNDTRKCLVLDGQQRLQSLYIGLHGSFSGRELHFNLLSGSKSTPDAVRYEFEFKDKTTASYPWISFKELVITDLRPHQLIVNLAKKFKNDFSEEEKLKINDNIDQINRSFKQEEFITYQELDSTSHEDLYSEDDVVEIFIRANSGGTKLEKSDLLFSLLNSTWDVADNKMEELLEDLNRHGFAFNRDFVLKTCLVLLDQGAQYEVSRFREHHVRESIENNWDKMSQSIRSIVDFIRGKTYIQCDKALPSYLALIPLIYIQHHYPESWRTAKDVDKFLVRSLLAGAFSGHADTVINALVNKFREIKKFSLEDGFSIIRNQNRSLEITKDRLFEMGYGSKNIHLIFNLWYASFNHTPAYDNNLPQIDHIFPQSLLRAQRETNPETQRQVMKYRDADRNQLANCMLLSREENGAGGKGGTPPSEWFENQKDDYLDLHLIPKNRELWKIERYEDFIEERKKLIYEKFKNFIVQ